MTTITYREEARAKCPACQRTVAAIRKIEKGVGPVSEQLVSRHLYQEKVELNPVGAPVEYTDGFCPGSMDPVKS